MLDKAAIKPVVVFLLTTLCAAIRGRGVSQLSRASLSCPDSLPPELSLCSAPCASLCLPLSPATHSRSPEPRRPTAGVSSPVTDFELLEASLDRHDRLEQPPLRLPSKPFASSPSTTNVDHRDSPLRSPSTSAAADSPLRTVTVQERTNTTPPPDFSSGTDRSQICSGTTRSVAQGLIIFIPTGMALSSSFSVYMWNRDVCTPKLDMTNEVFTCKQGELFNKKVADSRLLCSSNSFHELGFLSSEKTPSLGQKTRVACHSVAFDKTHTFSVGQKFQLDDIIDAQQFDRDTLIAIFEVAREMEKIEKKSTGNQILKGYLMATLFYEPSTRTRLSFESAMRRLGGEVLTTENAREFSSAAKGETLEDTIRTVEGYSDIIVMRHFESGAARKAAATAEIPIINAGDGPGQHPTQALLDVYTIEREIGKIDGIAVALVGDLAHGRTVRSLAYLLAEYNDVKIYFVAPDVVKMKDDIKDYLTSKNVKWEESTDLMEVASNCDVVYQTRIQKERFGERIDLYEEARGKYIVDRDVLNVMQKHAVVMHPLPRLDEITVDVDDDPRAAYFRQAKNGLHIRMALLKLLLTGW